MSRFEINRFDAAIVVVGSLNPAIVTPDWLLSKELISESDRDEARGSLQVVAQQGFLAFECSWFSTNVVANKLTILTKTGSSPRVRDLVVGIFHLLGETPVTAVGINFHAECRIPSANDYHRLGDVLAPKEPWHAQFPSDKFSVGLKALQIEIRDGARAAGFPTGAGPRHTSVLLLPSPSEVGGVTVQVNNHADLAADSHGTGVAALLMSEWESYEERSRAVVDSLFKTVLPSP